MRNKVVKIADKEILVTEKRIKELKELSNKLSVSFNQILNTEVDDKTTDDVISNITDILSDKIIIIFPQLTTEDIESAYPSEIEELITSFIDVNFQGAKKVISQAMKLK